MGDNVKPCPHPLAAAYKAVLTFKHESPDSIDIFNFPMTYLFCQLFLALFPVIHNQISAGHHL
jgi:hypothetical protein